MREAARHEYGCHADAEAAAAKLRALQSAYHGVDVGRFDSAGASSTAKSGAPLILSVGRLCEKKGFPYLIRACRILKDRGVERVRVVLAAPPDEYKGDAAANLARLSEAASAVDEGSMAIALVHQFLQQDRPMS